MSLLRSQFIGATDSAAPCSTLLDVAESLTPLLRHKQTLVQADEYEGDEEWAHTTLQIVLFDGEEAFHDWTATDSIYGAR
jgi:glutaminyl-peptide cyclotransferase